MNLTEQVTLYRICIQGHIQASLMEQWFSFQVKRKRNGITVLTGPILDHSALQALPDYLFGLGITLLSVHRLG